MLFLSFLFVSCKSDSKAPNAEEVQIKKEVMKNDSISNELDNVKGEIENSAKELDNLIKDLN